VLFVTGYSADRLARSDALGPHDRVLEKPYQLEELARTIRDILEARVMRAAAHKVTGPLPMIPVPAYPRRRAATTW
jgi:hypothetical protein